MLDHKKHYCKMRFTCKCEDIEVNCGEHDCGSSKDSSLPPLNGTNQKYQEVVYSSSIISECDKIVSRGKKVSLRCNKCKKNFTGAWDLMFHVQNVHGVNIYNLEEKEKVFTLIKRIFTCIFFSRNVLQRRPSDDFLH